MKRSREFSSPLNGTYPSWAQKELFIRCLQRSACLYWAWPCSEAQQTTSLLKAQFIGQLQSPGPQSRAQGSSLGIDIKVCAQVDLMACGQLQAAGGGWGLRGLAYPQPLESSGKQLGSGMALRAPTSKALGHCFTCCRQLSKVAGRWWRAEGLGRGIADDPKPA